jgi:hypothetical protein
MGWFDNLWRRRQGRTTETERDTAEARAAEPKEGDENVADELEEEAFRLRTEEIYREPRIPPGTS